MSGKNTFSTEIRIRLCAQINEILDNTKDWFYESAQAQNKISYCLEIEGLRFLRKPINRLERMCVKINEVLDTTSGMSDMERGLVKISDLLTQEGWRISPSAAY